ncbi:MAG: Rrf2 family transcriptional regulator [Gammaproteobacteria bacterium]|jgi:Rrf2 family iron-sulfur cluster assembly transcriptional regulator|nr:Rrf2 family transcriptional regulator [Gammaproteobacteria bacterium]MDH3984972.1 Rrf2 family transcriptional regulator [Gammaproteobacteria bacterium]
MRLSTKGRYAVTAMLDLAIRYDDGPVTLADISETQGISLSYLEQLFAKLKKKGLVTGLRGPGGGYRLAHGPAEITIARILNAIGESIDATLCEGKEDCQEGERCLTHALWQKLGAEIYGFLNDITLAGFLDREKVSEIVRRQQNTVTMETPGLVSTIV